MNHEITESVKCDSESDEKKIAHPLLYAIVKKNDAGCGKNHKEDIIPFENISIFGLVMIGMKIPHQTMHYILMRQPGHTFHKKKNTQKDQKGNHYFVIYLEYTF
jgi:hypothetical protein